MKLTSRASIQIQKSIETVYEAIVDPKHMTQYFISESNGRLDSNEHIKWKFPEFDDRFPIDKIIVEKNMKVSFVWDPDSIVTIELDEQEDKSTVVRVSEGAKELNQENLDWLIGNSGGWANFLACMKAYLEHNIQLRKGAYDFMKK